METLEIKIVEKRLSKYSTDQLLKKVKENLFSTPEEHQIAINILTQRGKWTPEMGEAVSDVVSEIPAVVVVDTTNTTSESLPVEESNTEVKVGEQVKEKTIREIIDEVYALNNNEMNRKLCSLFPEEFDDYEELGDEIKDEIREFHKSVFDPNYKPVEKKKEQPKEKVVEVSKDVVEKIRASKKERSKPTEKLPNEGEKVDKNITIEKSKNGIKAGDIVIFDHKGGTIEGEVTRVLYEHRMNKEVCRVKTADSIYIKTATSLKVK